MRGLSRESWLVTSLAIWNPSSHSGPEPEAVLCERGSMIRVLSPVYGGLTAGQAMNASSYLSLATALLEGCPQSRFPGEE